VDIPQVPQQGSPIGLIIIGAGVFIVWLAWRRKRGGSGQPVFFVPMPGLPARRRTNPLLIILLFAGLIAALFWGADWLNGHLPPAPGNRR
jgi:hypothetical protein